MANIFKHINWFEKIGIGGLTSLLGFGGFALWLCMKRTYRLILRNEKTILDTPTLFVWVGVLFSILALWLLWKLAASQNREVGWYWKKGGRSNYRGGPLRWEDVIFGVVPGVVLGTIGVGWWINCALDTSNPKVYSSTILRMPSGVGSKGGRNYLLILKDWKNPKRSIAFPCSWEIYETHRVGEQVKIATRKGLLDYEWTTDFKSH